MARLLVVLRSRINWAHLYKHLPVKQKDKTLRPVDDPRRELKVVQRGMKRRARRSQAAGHRAERQISVAPARATSQ